MPYRNRGNERRELNLERVLEHLTGFDVHVVDDGRTGDAQFNRSAAYNRGVAETRGTVIFHEADMLVPHCQLVEAAWLAQERPGLVIPFRNYSALGEDDSVHILNHTAEPADFEPVLFLADGFSMGAVGAASRVTLDAIGQWDECFEGAWFDDNAMFRAFEVAAGPARWVDGGAYHLWHLPGQDGDHLSDADRAATDRNRDRFEVLYQRAHTAEQIRSLTAGSWRL